MNMIFYNKQIFDRCFCYKGKYWYKNIKYIPYYFRLINHLVKYGYDEYAIWETFNWFIRTMKSILPNYHSAMGCPVVVDNYPSIIKTEKDSDIVAENETKWHSIIDRMLELLDLMDETNPRYDNEDYSYIDSEMDAAKNEFFELFSKYFYNLWD